MLSGSLQCASQDPWMGHGSEAANDALQLPGPVSSYGDEIVDSLNLTTLSTILVSNIATCDETTPLFEVTAEPNYTADSINAIPGDTTPHASGQSALVTPNSTYATRGPPQFIQER